MNKSTNQTTDHEVIKKWAEERGGKPAVVRGTENTGRGAGLLRIFFPDFKNEKSLKEITWEEFFDTFDSQKLTFIYQENVDGERSNFSKFIRK